MTAILITGNTGLFTESALDQISEQYRIVIAGESPCRGKKKNIRMFHTSPTEETFGQLFDAYTFEAVWYVTGYADGGNGTFGELQMLEKTMQECSRAGVEKVVLLSTVESQNYTEHFGRSGELLSKEYASGTAYAAAQMEEYGRFLAERMERKLIILWLPYLTGQINDRSFLGTVFCRMYEKQQVRFAHRREDRADFLSLEDLAVLLEQITEETEDKSDSYYAVSGYSYRYGDLEAVLKVACPDVEIVYEDQPDWIDWPVYPARLRKMYGFVPTDNQMLHMGSLYRAFVRKSAGPGGRWREKAGEIFGKAGQGLFQYAELLLAFGLTEFVAQYTSQSVYFQYVDVRLLFIVMIATMYGMRMGTVAGVLECIVLVRNFQMIGMPGIQLFYNIENWVPFAVYIMTGVITGYVKNKNTEEAKFAKEEYRLLRNKYLFLNDVYHSAIQNKGDYARQILGFKDSFGKIFDAVQKLDNELPQRIFLAGLHVLEDILQNRTIAIYSVDAQQLFGRLMVCSNSQLSVLTKSLRLEQYQEMCEIVSRGGVWKNTRLKEGLPMYAAGVFRDETMVLLITVQEVTMEQYGMDYMNIFRIMCGLVQTSFLKALRYEELLEAELYYPNTSVLYPEHFLQRVSVQEDMRLAGVAHYMLIRLEEREKETVSRKLSGVVRATDFLGAAEDGTIYLLLVQMNRQNFRPVGDRLEKQGISYQIVEKVSAV